ncbi:hypothetical protein ACFWJS_41335 [Streptomyces sp. NPDC127061]|uniref:hypothetical protein n=1 Tax=Streptomyces sp. NPDC127061 TaxID=3347122 RepID=UPI0036657AB1
MTVLVNSAGLGRFGPFAELTWEQWDRTFAVNTRGNLPGVGPPPCQPPPVRSSTLPRSAPG